MLHRSEVYIKCSQSARLQSVTILLTIRRTCHAATHTACIRQWPCLVERVRARAARHLRPWPASVREERTISCRVMGSRSRRSPSTTRLRRRRCRGRFCTRSNHSTWQKAASTTYHPSRMRMDSSDLDLI